MSSLPIHAVLDDLRAALTSARSAVLEAPPGAGKTTVVPLALLNEDWLAGRKILMLEPRRLAAKNAARFMAQSLNEKPGGTVGYRVRLDTCVSGKTRIEVVTEGVLTRMLQEDPALEGVGLVIFDEFHERNLQADLGLALTLDARANLREDLAVLVMSATLDGAAIAALLNDAPIVHTQGRQYPVETRYQPASGDIAAALAQSILKLMREEEGSLLAFLPGGREIRRVQELLCSEISEDTELHPLYGDLPPAEQDAAIRPAPSGKRKIVLATNIAESSLTIEGVCLVVDSGLERAPVFDPPSGMTRLVTRKISQASADQRRGRAGRTAPGICLRLWSESETARMSAQATPEILAADLAPLALELAAWGAHDPVRLHWLDKPPLAALSQARDLLQALGALDENHRLTAHGRAMAALPVHPRLAHMLLKGQQAGYGGLAASIAALLSERDPLAQMKQADIALRLQALANGKGITRGQQQRLRETAMQIVAHVKATLSFEPQQKAAWLIAEAYPDRIAKRRPGKESRYLLAGGRGAILPEGDRLGQSQWLAVAQLEGSGRESRIFLAAELAPDDVAALEQEAGESIEVRFDEKARAVIARRVRRAGRFILEEHPVPVPVTSGDAKLLNGIRHLGIGLLPWPSECEQLCARVELLRKHGFEDWPACDADSLAADLENWLAPFVSGITRIADISGSSMRQALEYRIGHDRVRELSRLLPERFTMPSGKLLAIDYSGEEPVLAARIQQFFGLCETPRIADGKITLTLELLSPANRPMQVTRDLASFWKNTYPEVRKDLRGRYPKHAWPENPLA